MDEPQLSGAAFSGKRFLPLEGARNVRDLGGYLGEDGRTVKWGCLMRAGDLDLLTDSDLRLLNSLGLKTFIDFRRPAERTSAPDKCPASVTENVALPIDPGDIELLAARGDASPEELMAESYSRMIRDFQEEYGRFFALLAEEDRAPLLFHCTAGKDRTGFAAALLLSALGVNRRTLIADYILSAEGLGDKYAGFMQKHPRLGALATINESYLEGALDLIDQDFGGMENFLRSRLKADLPRLRSLYLQ